IASVVVEAEEAPVDRLYDRRSYALEDAEGFERMARNCFADLRLTVGEDDARQWIVGIRWNESHPRVREELVVDRAAERFQESPPALGECIQEGIANLPPRNGPSIELLVAFRTAAWVRAHGADAPIEERDRRLLVDATLDGHRHSSLPHDVKRAAIACVRELLPTPTRPRVWGIHSTLVWTNPNAQPPVSGTGGLSLRRAESRLAYPFAEAPEGFDECIRDRIPTSSPFGGSIFEQHAQDGREPSELRVWLRAFSQGFAEAHIRGVVGRGGSN
ncbi:MAG: hypothetical protein AAGF12_42600, partial [Myxococcota bacterium]